jgi:hypothetical protein
VGDTNRPGASSPDVFLHCTLVGSRVGRGWLLRSLRWGNLSLRWGASKGFFDCSVEVLLCYSACTANGFKLSLRGLADVSRNPTRGCRAVGMASWVRAMAVGTHSFVWAALVLPLVSVRTITALHTAGYSGAAGSVAVSLTAWVMSLYGWMFVDLL